MKFIAAVAFSLLSASALAFDFKGIKLGEPATRERIFDATGVKCGIGITGAIACFGNTTVANVTANMDLSSDPSGIVQKISFLLKPSDFELVAIELMKKFGTPTSREGGQLQNGFGAKFEQQTLTWENEAGDKVTFIKYAGSIRTSFLIFQTRQDLAEQLLKQKAKGSDL